MKDILEIVNEAVVHGNYDYSTHDNEVEKQETRVVVSDLSSLIYEIGRAIQKNGNNCSLNHIDVSRVSDFSELFYNWFRDFDGDISGWNMERATNCNRMFCMSSFTGRNGDISGWNMDNVVTAQQMFYKSKFDGDISNWTLPSLDKKKSQQFMGGAVLAKTRKHWPKIFR